MADYEEAIRLAHETKDQHTALSCLIEIPGLIYNTTLKDKVPAFCEQGLELARALEDKGAMARLELNLAYWRYRWEGSDEYKTLQKAFNLAEDSGQPLAILHCRLFSGEFERWNGNPQRALEWTEGLDEIARVGFNVFLAGMISFVRAFASIDIGKYGEGIRVLERMIDECKQTANYLFL